MFVLDTNVASELMRPVPAPAVAAWIAQRDAEVLFLTAVGEAELRYGIAILPVGRRRTTLEASMTRWLSLGFAERILPFDSAAAWAFAEIAAARRIAGRPIGEADCQIAAIARSRGMAVVTRNGPRFLRNRHRDDRPVGGCVRGTGGTNPIRHFDRNTVRCGAGCPPTRFRCQPAPDPPSAVCQLLRRSGARWQRTEIPRLLPAVR